jgi:small subunit ribosomal protein S3Ae
MAKKVKTAIPNWKKKKFYELVAPAIFGDKSLGEAFAFAPENLVGKTVQTNMMTLTGNPRKQNFSVKFKIVKIIENKGHTKPVKLTMLHSSIRRLIRSGKERVDGSFTAVSKDDVTLRIKPLLITKSLTTKSKLTDLQAKTKEFLTDYIQNHTYEAVFDATARTTLQKELKNVAEKVFPLKMVEIRVLEVELLQGTRTIPEHTSAPETEKTEEVKAPAEKPAKVEKKVEEEAPETEETKKEE